MSHSRSCRICTRADAMEPVYSLGHNPSQATWKPPKRLLAARPGCP